MLSKRQIKRLPADPVGYIPVINRENIPGRLAGSLPGRFLPMSIRRYQSKVMEILEDKISADIVLDSYLRKFFGVRFPNDPVKIIKKHTHTVLLHTLDKSVVVKKPWAKYGRLSVLCTVQSVPLHGVFACLARVKVSVPEEVAGKICKVLAAINVVPNVIRHGDPNHCCLWSMRCLSLNKQVDRHKVRQLACYLRDLDRPISTKAKTPAASAAPTSENIGSKARFSR